MRERPNDLETGGRPEAKRARRHIQRHNHSIEPKPKVADNNPNNSNPIKKIKVDEKVTNDKLIDSENNNQVEKIKVNNIPVEDIKDYDILKIAAKNIVEINDPEKLMDESNQNFDFDFLNDTNKDSGETPEDKDNSCSQAENNETKPVIDDPIEILTEENSRSSVKIEEQEESEVKSMFGEDLNLGNGNTYENLFNGNSDEHYFQAFKDNNLPLFATLQEKTDANDEISKLLHSPLDFLNEKFLTS